MNIFDMFYFSFVALIRHPLRAGLIILAMGIGVGSIIFLSTIGEGARQFVIGEFASLGTHLLIVIPGKAETSDSSASLFSGETTRDLTLRDAQALSRISTVRMVSPVIVGSADVSWHARDREAPVLGASHNLLQIRHWEMSLGNFLPDIDFDQTSPVCVIGTKIKDELFGSNSAIGEWLRIGDRRFRVFGVLSSEGRSIGVDSQEIVIVPVASAQSLFNTESLFRILIEARSRTDIPQTQQAIQELIQTRHQGEKDITVLTQDSLLGTFDKVLRTLTLTVSSIAAISILVAGIMIMNVMLVSVSQRTPEIGLLKALGASKQYIVSLFMIESLQLSLIGSLTGIILGAIGNYILQLIYPIFPVATPWWAFVFALTIAISIGTIFSVYPALKAARLDPIDALAHAH